MVRQGYLFKTDTNHGHNEVIGTRKTDTVTLLQENAMPAIAPIEDLRAAQEEGLSIYAMR